MPKPKTDHLEKRKPFLSPDEEGFQEHKTPAPRTRRRGPTLAPRRPKSRILRARSGNARSGPSTSSSGWPNISHTASSSMSGAGGRSRSASMATHCRTRPSPGRTEDALRHYVGSFGYRGRHDRRRRPRRPDGDPAGTVSAEAAAPAVERVAKRGEAKAQARVRTGARRRRLSIDDLRTAARARKQRGASL